jgi:hypothetical protein
MGSRCPGMEKERALALVPCFLRAVVLFPNGPAPRVGLAALAPGNAVPFDTLDGTDPHYSYPCVLLTVPVDAELARRLNKRDNK